MTSASPSNAPATSPPKPPTVFVAGATGRVGYRVVRELAKRGCAVRAGSRNTDKAREAVGDLRTEQASLVEHVQFDVMNRAAMRDAIGDATVVVSTLGAPFSWGRVDGFGIADLVRESMGMPGVDYMVVVSSIGVGRPWVLPAGLLNLAGGVLLFKDYSEGVLRRVAGRAGKGYLIVRPGGMERPGDDFGQTHNVRVEGRNRLAAGVISRLQVAQVIAEAVVRKETLGGKTIEVVAERDAPKVDIGELLEKAEMDDSWARG